MNTEWFNSVEMNDAQKTDLYNWCEHIGFERYEKIYKLIHEHVSGKVSYSMLSALARYDFNLSDFVHSMIKFIELRFRAFLINKYGDIIVSKNEYLYQISASVGENERFLDCSTFYDKSLPRETKLSDYLNASGMQTLFNVFLILNKEELEIFGQKEQIEKDFEIIRKARNIVAHGQVLINNEKLDLNEAIKVLFKYMPTEASRVKRITQLKDLTERILIKEGEIPACLLDKVSIVLE